MVRTGLAMTVKDQAAEQDGLGINLGICLGFFYANNGMIGAQDSEWLQNAPNALICIFQ